MGEHLDHEMIVLVLERNDAKVTKVSTSPDKVQVNFKFDDDEFYVATLEKKGETWKADLCKFWFGGNYPMEIGSFYVLGEATRALMKGCVGASQAHKQFTRDKIEQNTMAKFTKVV